MNDIIYSLCNHYKINLYEVKLNFTTDYLNRSLAKFYWAKPKDYTYLGEIYLGIFDNEEFKEISFYHELGHCIVIYPENYLDCSEYKIEKLAWDEGFKIAKQHKIKFSKKALQWANEQLKTYSKNVLIKDSKKIV